MTLPRKAVIAGAAATALFGAVPLRARAAEFTYKFANNQSLDGPLNVAAREMVEQISKDSGGRLQIEIFPNNTLGGDTAMFTQLRSGAIDFFTLPGPIVATVVPVASIDAVGFAFKDSATVFAALDGDLGAYVRGEIGKTDIVAMDRVWDLGFRQISSRSSPVNTAADLAGFKIRVPFGPLWTSMFTILKAVPTSVNFSELYVALQTHVVDGQENPLLILQLAKLYEVQKFVALTNHMWVGFWFLANKQSWEKLPKNLQDIAAKNINAAALRQRVLVEKQNAVLQSELEKKGLVFNKPDVPSFRTALQTGGFYSDWRTKFGPKAWALLQKYTGPLG